MKKYQSLALSALSIILLTACTVSSDNDEQQTTAPSSQERQVSEESAIKPEQDLLKPQIQKKSAAAFDSIQRSPAPEQVLPVISEDDDMPRLD